ncbi:MAG: carboxypeptidase-like regulatory domain-containing protein [Bacteroidales bacterium]|nr:carboxypeptidase-like regulatory domain-containing protein [Bacteroidales bacterium]
MKKLSILLVLVGAAAIFFSSCNKEYAEPTITWTPDGLSQYVNVDDVATHNKTLAIAFTAEAGIKEITIWKHTYKMLDVESEVFASPTGYAGLTDFTHVLTTDNAVTDFGNGVTKIVYEVEITDESETPQTTKKEYTFMIDEAYTVTINVNDAEGVAIEDAKVTFNSVVKNAAPYTFEYIMAGTYAYMVEKAGYQTVEVTNFAMIDKDTTFNVTLLENLSAYSAEIPLALISEIAWAEYNGAVIGTHENTTIGFAFTYTDGSKFKVTKTTNCTGWVLIEEADANAFTTTSELVTAYNSGNVINEFELPATIAKAYAPRYFVSKVGDNYLLVKYAYGYRNGADNTGNVVVFQYKD